MMLHRGNLEKFTPCNLDLREGATVLIDKPIQWTSFDIVKKMRYLLKKAYNQKRFKVGHAGTLDPLATGLLIVLLGKATKKQDEFMRRDKVYEATMELGYVTASYDGEMEKVKYGDPEGITIADVERVAAAFIGEIKQSPPIYSAIKVDGIPLYKYAREGKKVHIKERNVTIHDIEIKSLRDNLVVFQVKCGAGVYMRSLAHDLGRELGCGAYLSQLRRTSIGEYHIEQALSMDEFISLIEERYCTS